MRCVVYKLLMMGMGKMGCVEIMMVIVLMVFLAVTSAHEISQLQVPLYADPRREAELSCHFRMDDQRLHSVKFYRDMYEIFRYNPSQTSPIRLFNVSGVAVLGGECLAASCAVRIMPPPLAGRAAYSCEVSTEGPKFKIARQTKHMTVVAMPEKDPEITGAPKLVSPGEQVVLNCTSAPSLPPAEINWYVDEEQQKSEQWQNTELSEPTSTGLQSSWRVLKLVVPTTASGILRVRCESLLVVEPPVVRDTITTITVHARTQLSKYVSNGVNQQYQQEIVFNLCVFWTLKVTVRFLLNL